ncbi:MAG: ribosome small subunit-dependent GTPase A [Bacteroidia bacterium]|nr:ribosome small subunit-dependent GTPase A [Bacteroidia bacterium]
MKVHDEGLVIKSTGSWYKVKLTGNNVIDCKIKGNIRIQNIKSTNPVAVGDRVEVIQTGEQGVGVITGIKDRKNFIIRRSSNLSRQTSILAANVDLALIVVTLVFPETQPEFIDRFLATTEAYSVPAILVFNKTDLYDERVMDYLNEFMLIYEKAGYACFAVSAIKNLNIDPLREAMKDRINVVTGNSGVGKSTLINAIDPLLDLKTSEISYYHMTGKHTTSNAEMFTLSTGGYVIDTPGIKGFGVFDFQKTEIYHFFPEIFRTTPQCQFYNCTHIHEPNCAVKEAVASGEISESRYNSYLNIYFGNDKKYR